MHALISKYAKAAVVVTIAGRTLVALDEKTGKKLWSRQRQRTVWS
jgi:outer membrane protein assembly factor BamB